MHEALPEYDAVLVASGTATLETGYFGIPMLIVYRVSNITYQLAKRLVKIKHIGLVNIVAEKEVVKELVQDAFTVENTVAEITRLLKPDAHQKMKQDLKIIRDKLGEPGVSARAAKRVNDFIFAKQALNSGYGNG